MTTLLILFFASVVTGGLMWLGGFNKDKMGLFVAHLLLGFACVEGAAHLVSMSNLADVEAVRSSSRTVLLLVAVLLLSGFGVLGMHRNRDIVRVVHAGAGVAALLMVLSISRQL